MEERMMYRVPDEFIHERQGRKMVLYAGLLDAAHAQGLVGIDTELLQIPNAENGNVAITKATVTMSSPDDAAHLVRIFSGIGDASPANVGRNIQEHIIRMAETRSKARALRDAVDIGGLMIADDVSESEATVVEQTAGSLAPLPAPTLPETLAPKKKQDYLKGLIEQLEMEDGRAHFELKHGAISTFSPVKADYWIDHFKEIIEGSEAKEEDEA